MLVGDVVGEAGIDALHGLSAASSATPARISSS